MKNLNDLLDNAAQEDGSRVAMVFGPLTFTYAGLREYVLGTAAGFQQAGVKKGDCVAIIHRNDPAFVVAYFALARLGAVAVPINFMVQKADELAYMLNDCRAVGVLTQQEFLKGVRGAKAKCPTLSKVWITDFESLKEPAAGEEPFADVDHGEQPRDLPVVDEQDTVGILYTSGTTGNPKGVMLTHRNLVTNCRSSVAVMGLKRSDVFLCILPMFHTFAWTANVLVSIAMHSKLVISASIAPAKPWLKQMAAHGVSLFSAVPQVYAVLTKEAKGLKGLVLRYWFFRKVRLAISGAAPLNPTVQDEFEQTFGLRILEGYGLTETSPVATINPPTKPKRGSVGVPIDGCQVRVVDDQETPQPSGTEGEICIKGDNVMKGYFNLPEATRDAFTKDGWFKTGDIGIIDEDGYVAIKDRKKDMIIVKGLKVFSAQVESVLTEHPDVEEAAVIGVPDATGDEQIKAFFVMRKGAKTDKAALMAFCRQRLDPYKRPRDVEIVEALPKNALQKVLKRQLRAQELQKKAASAGGA